MINIGKRREVFWDDYLTDTQKTTAEKRLPEPVPRAAAYPTSKVIRTAAPGLRETRFP